MIEIERKLSFVEIESSNSNNGLYLIRVATKIPMDSEFAKGMVINHLKNEVAVKFSGGDFSLKRDTLTKDLDILSNAPIIFSKRDKYSKECGEIEYHQIVIGVEEEAMVNSARRSSYLYNIVSQLTQSLYGNYSYGEDWIQPLCPTVDFVYTLSDIRVNRGSNVLLIGNQSNLDLTNFVKEEYKPSNHIAISFDVDTNKNYNRGSIMKLTCRIWENLPEAFDNKNSNTITIDQFDALLGKFNFTIYKQVGHGGLRIYVLYKSKPKLYWHKNMAVFYDGEKSFEKAKNYFDIWERRGVKQVDLLQFCHNKDFFYQDIIGKVWSVNKLVLVFLNKDRIALTRSELVLNRSNTGFNGRLGYSPRKNQKRIFLDVSFGGRNMTPNHYLGTGIIPIDTSNTQDKALETITNIIKLILLSNEEIEHTNMPEQFEIYKKCLFDLGESKPDTLSEWFKFCTLASKQNDDGIVKAYERMKKNLEKEYIELSTYLNHYDFSKCMPIPSVKMDKKMIENYYKSLHIEAKNIIINSINHKNIKSIQELQPTVTFMFIDHKKRILKGDYPINKFYNAKTNEIELLYDKLKGEVVNDKVKNRR